VEELKGGAADRRRVFAELKGPREEIAAGVRKLPGVHRVQAAASGDWTRLDIAAQGDAQDAVSALASARGWAVRELRLETPSLEDFFVKAIIEARKQSS
jgi:ABC-type uncharacterized transport system ATPase subunit